MAIVTKSTTASLDARSGATAGYISGLFAGEALTALDACYIKDDGLVYKAVTTAKTGTTSSFAGFAGKDVPANSPVTLFRASAIASYSDGAMTPGTMLFVSATAGALADAVVLTGDVPVAMAISASDIVIIK